jgi:hypothetical protein
MPYSATKQGGMLNDTKETTFTPINQSTAISKAMLTLNDDGKWIPEYQGQFSSYMGEFLNGWGNLTSAALARLFDGSDLSIDILDKIISGGKLISGMCDTPECGSAQTSSNKVTAELRTNIGKTAFAFAIPAIWAVSKMHAFIIDSGSDCEVTDPLGQYLSSDNMKATEACVEGKLYYIASPEGAKDKKFTAPEGLEYLDGKAFGGVTKDDLIKGAVRTYIQNGGKNGGMIADDMNRDTFVDLLDVDVTTPDFIRMPVCGAEQALQAWNTGDSSGDNYPCGSFKF